MARIKVKKLIFVIEAKFEIDSEMNLEVVNEAIEKLQEQGSAEVVRVEAEEN